MTTEPKPPLWQNLKVIKTTALYLVFGLFFVVGIFKWMGQDQAVVFTVQLIGVLTVLFVLVFWAALKADHERKNNKGRRR